MHLSSHNFMLIRVWPIALCSFEINEPSYSYLSCFIFVYDLVWLFLGEDRKRRDFTLHGELILILLKQAVKIVYKLR